jgi:tetratricopeptide (TPR) repeat protein
MTRSAYWGLILLLLGMLAVPAYAQDITDPKEYDAYKAIFDEKDQAKKGELAEKFLADFPKTTARIQAYTFALLGYAQGGVWAKALDIAEKQPTLAPAADDKLKLMVIQVGLGAAQQLKNVAKTQEYAEKSLTANPNDLNALLALSGILSSSLPTAEAPRQAQITRALEITNRALKQPMPQGVQPADWNPVQVQLNRTVCQLHLNQKKYEETITACQQALKLNSKDAGSYYLTGLALKYQVPPLQDSYRSAIDEYNANRTGDPALVAELKAKSDAMLAAAEAKLDEAIGAFAKAVAIGGINEARTELENLYKGKNNGSIDGLDALIAQKKAEL